MQLARRLAIGLLFSCWACSSPPPTDSNVDLIPVDRGNELGIERLEVRRDDVDGMRRVDIRAIGADHELAVLTIQFGNFDFSEDPSLAQLAIGRDIRIELKGEAAEHASFSEASVVWPNGAEYAANLMISPEMVPFISIPAVSFEAAQVGVEFEVLGKEHLADPSEATYLGPVGNVGTTC